jgi:two-component system, NarL family, response regulator
MATDIRVLVADDHPLIQAGLTATINAEPDMRVVATASDGRTAVTLFREHHPDVALVDLRMPVMDGLEAIRAIMASCPEARIVVLSTYQGDEQIFKALDAGARTYLLKDMLAAEVVRSIRDVHAGARPLPPVVSHKLAERMLATPLTPRELDVLKLVAQGLRNKEIAAALSIADLTVQSHVKSVLEKFGVHDRTEAVAIAARRGIIHFD